MKSVINLKSAQFRREREHTWDELERLISRAEKGGLSVLTEDELTKLPTLYRNTISSLSVARAISLDQNVTDYLESLCGRAYFYVYGTRQKFRDALREFFVNSLLTSFHQNRWYILCSALLFGLGGLIGFFSTLDNMENFYLFIDPGYAQGREPGATTESLKQTLYTVKEQKADLAVFASFLFTHNSKIALMCVALGILGALPVIYLLLTNGLLLGAFTALFHSRGLSLDVWGWLLPHGITELFAIIICGAVGLVIGRSVLIPGRYRRVDNLMIKAREAGPLIICGVLMLFVAGLIEGIFRQTVTDINIRYTMALFTAVFWIFYFGFLRTLRQKVDT